MAERPDPDTDWATLADRLWATTDMMYDHEAMVDDVTAGDLRAAADGLRQLADENRALREAIARAQDRYKSSGAVHWLAEQIAAADRGVTDGEATTSRRPVQFDAYASNPWPDGEATDG